MPENIADRIQLGKTGIKISPLGLGAWSWGDRLVWGYGGGVYTDEDIRAGYTASLDGGINWIDTAELYGRGRSETLAGRFTADTATEHRMRIATKFFPYPWRFNKGQLVKALRGSLKRLGLEAVDLYQIHWPFPPMPVETWVEGLAEVFDAGLARAVGVSNYSQVQMRRANEVLARRGIPLASNQVPYSLIDRRVEKSGLLQACQELGITLIAYSPLAQGVLTGKYTPKNPPPGTRSRKYGRVLLEKVQPLIKRMGEIGQADGGKSPSQVALNWAICKGTAPIPGAKNARQAAENVGALGWRLSDDQVVELDSLSDQVSGYKS